jgi:hypothetical protein
MSAAPKILIVDREVARVYREVTAIERVQELLRRPYHRLSRDEQYELRKLLRRRQGVTKAL